MNSSSWQKDFIAPACKAEDKWHLDAWKSKPKFKNEVSTYSQNLWQTTARWLLLKLDLPTNLITAIIYSLF